MRTGSGHKGFTLMEMMVAIAVLSVALIAIMGAQQASLNGSLLVQRGQAAGLAMRPIILAIEEEYKREGFPENSLSDRTCEVPEEYERWFECRYNLERLDLDASQMSELVSQSFGGMMQGGGIEALMQGGDSSAIGGELNNMLQGGSGGLGGMDMSGLAFLAPFLGPDGQVLMSLCDVNLNILLMGFMGVQAFIPTVLENVSTRTRKLTVTLTWSDGPFGSRDYVVTTFITSRPEAELQQLRDQQELMDVLGVGGATGGTDGSTPATGGGREGGGGGGR